MIANGIWTVGLAYVGAIALAPVLLWALSRGFPARSVSSLDAGMLRDRYSRLNACANFAAIVAVWGAIGVGLWLRFPNTAWLLSYLLGWLVLAPLIVIAASTLPSGTQSWMDFWRFYEQKQRIRVRLLGPIYALLGLLGIISTAVLFVHRGT